MVEQNAAVQRHLALGDARGRIRGGRDVMATGADDVSRHAEHLRPAGQPEGVFQEHARDLHETEAVGLVGPRARPHCSLYGLFLHCGSGAVCSDLAVI